MTPEQEARLPLYAQDALASLRRENAAMRGALAPDPTEIVADATAELLGRPVPYLPDGAVVRFGASLNSPIDVSISTDLHGLPCVRIRSSGGSHPLVVTPDASNVITVRAMTPDERIAAHDRHMARYEIAE